MAELAREARRRLEEREQEERDLDLGPARELSFPPRVEPGAELLPVRRGPTLLAKVAAAGLGAVAFVILWRTVLGTLVQGVLSLALLALVLAAIARLLGWTPGSAAEDGEGA